MSRRYVRDSRGRFASTGKSGKKAPGGDDWTKWPSIKNAVQPAKAVEVRKYSTGIQPRHPWAVEWKG